MKVESYFFGFIKIDNKTYNHDILIFPTGIEKWWRKEGHNVSLEDLEKVWEFNPQIIIFGQGTPGLMKISEEVKNYLNQKNIEFHILPTTSAVKLWNELIEKYPNKVIIGAFHLTC
ncbi:MAG: MTH938/NDUFAF3 family protein [bacterium]|nr:MTH938/NDUFAF3 family protein [bacterium]MDW8164274.1 MTH938/NDUFAF3 family protein [Candidatus Omnitrophota bacterium]